MTAATCAADGEEDGALLLALPEHDVQHLPGQHVSPTSSCRSGPDRTLTIFEWFFAEPGTGAGWESMQQTIAFSRRDPAGGHRHLRAGAARPAVTRLRPGRFSAKRENGVYHFQNLVREFLRGIATCPQPARARGRLTVALVSEVFWQPDGRGRLRERLAQSRGPWRGPRGAARDPAQPVEPRHQGPARRGRRDRWAARA